jgi:hypothetical protein
VFYADFVIRLTLRLKAMAAVKTLCAALGMQDQLGVAAGMGRIAQGLQDAGP